MSDFASISNLTNPTDDEESVAGRFTKKQEEIKNFQSKFAFDIVGRANFDILRNFIYKL